MSSEGRSTVRTVRQDARAELRKEQSSTGSGSRTAKQRRSDTSERPIKKKSTKKSSKEGIKAPLFDDITGAPLNAAARALVEKEAQSRAEASGGDYSLDGKASEILSAVPDVLIAAGKYKYVQIKISIAGGGEKLVVRNTKGLRFHAEMYNAAMNQLHSEYGGIIKGSVVGGGRIRYDVKQKHISVYGYSKTFGRAAGCNKKSAELIRNAMPGFEVEWTDAGY
jgi:hypothetical protein